MRTLPYVLLLALVPLSGCVSNDSTTQSIPEEAEWIVAQADSLQGDVAGFVWEIPGELPCSLEDVSSASASASAEGASASAGGASASASAAGASASSGCLGASVSASAEGASVSAGGAAASAGLNGITLEVVPDVSALDGLKEYAFIVLAVKDGVAEHVTTILSTEIERVQSEAAGAGQSAIMEAQAMAFLVPFQDLGLEPGDQIAFVMAASANTQAEVKGIVQRAEQDATSLVGQAGLAVELPDFGFAFRAVDAAKADAAGAAAELEALARSGASQAADVAQAGADAAEAGADAAQDGAEAAASQAESLLDRVLATGKASAMQAVGIAQGFDVGFYAEFTNGALNGIENVQFLTESIDVRYTLESISKPLAATERLTLSYDGIAVDGWGFGLGAYGGSENGEVTYDLSAIVHDQSFSQAGTIAAFGPFDLGDADPAYILEGAGGQAQALAFELERVASEQATHLYALHADVSAQLTDLLGVGDVVQIAAEDIVNAAPVSLQGQDLVFGVGSPGGIRVAGVI